MTQKKQDRESLRQEALQLITALDAETQVPSTLLGRMKCSLERITKYLAAGDVPAAEQQHGLPLTRQIVDSWPLGNEVGRKISLFEERYMKWLSANKE
jgi:hypothetical protein